MRLLRPFNDREKSSEKLITEKHRNCDATLFLLLYSKNSTLKYLKFICKIFILPFLFHFTHYLKHLMENETF